MNFRPNLLWFLLLLFSAGLLVFFWGVIEFLWGLNAAGESSKDEGKRHMLWGLIGMFVMVSAYAIINFIAGNICGGTVQTCTSTFQ